MCRFFWVAFAAHSALAVPVTLNAPTEISFLEAPVIRVSGLQPLIAIANDDVGERATNAARKPLNKFGTAALREPPGADPQPEWLTAVAG